MAAPLLFVPRPTNLELGQASAAVVLRSSIHVLLCPVPIPPITLPLPHHAVSGCTGRQAPTSRSASPSANHSATRSSASATSSASSSATHGASSVVDVDYRVGGVRVPVTASAATSSAAASRVLVGTAPGLLRHRPPGLPVSQADVAVVRLAVMATTSTTCTGAYSNPCPVTVDLHVLPNHAVAGIDSWRLWALAALALRRAAPLLLGW